VIDPILMGPVPTPGQTTPAPTPSEGGPFELMLAALAGAAPQLTPTILMPEESSGEDGGPRDQSEPESTAPLAVATTLGDQIAAGRLGVMALVSEPHTAAQTNPIQPSTLTGQSVKDQEVVERDSLTPTPDNISDRDPLEIDPANGETDSSRPSEGPPRRHTAERPSTAPSGKQPMETDAEKPAIVDPPAHDQADPEPPKLPPNPTEPMPETGKFVPSKTSTLHAVARPTLPALERITQDRKPQGPDRKAAENLLRVPVVRGDPLSPEASRPSRDIARVQDREFVESPTPRIDQTLANTDDRPDLAPGRLSGAQETARVEVRPLAARMAERIETWIKTTENAPPPRSITLRGAELHGLTIRVSVVHDGLSIQLEGTKGDDIAWMRQVIQNLGDKGFDISEFAEYDSEGERRQLWDEEQADQRRRRPDFDPFLEDQLT